MKYDSNRSGLELLKKMFVKFHKHRDNVQVGLNEHTMRLMGEIFGSLSDDQKKEYKDWEEMRIMWFEIEKERNK